MEYKIKNTNPQFKDFKIGSNLDDSQIYALMLFDLSKNNKQENDEKSVQKKEKIKVFDIMFENKKSFSVTLEPGFPEIYNDEGERITTSKEYLNYKKNNELDKLNFTTTSFFGLYTENEKEELLIDTFQSCSDLIKTAEEIVEKGCFLDIEV